jgi:hypothetical protein
VTPQPYPLFVCPDGDKISDRANHLLVIGWVPNPEDADHFDPIVVIPNADAAAPAFRLTYDFHFVGFKVS